MGANNSSNVSTPDIPIQLAVKADEQTFEGPVQIPLDLEEHMKQTFLVTDASFVYSVQRYYRSDHMDREEMLRMVASEMIGVRFSPDTRTSSLSLVLPYATRIGSIPGAYIERDNVLTMERAVAEGTFGEVWLAHINGYPIVVKIAKSGYQQSLLEEIMLTTLITSPRARQCYMYHVRSLNVEGLDRFPFGQVTFALKNTSVLGSNLMMGMERFDLTVFDLFDKPEHRGSEADLMDVLAQILQHLHVAQTTFGLQHKDLKSNNIMLVRRPVPVQVARRIGATGPFMTLCSTYQVVIIDLGASCANMSACGVNLRIENLNTAFDQSRVLCGNKSYDIIMLLISLIPTMPRFFHTTGSPRIAAWWAEFIAPVVHLTGRADLLGDDVLSLLYTERVLADLDSDNTHPDALFSRLLEIFQRLALDDAKTIAAAEAAAQELREKTERDRVPEGVRRQRLWEQQKQFHIVHAQRRYLEMERHQNTFLELQRQEEAQQYVHAVEPPWQALPDAEDTNLTGMDTSPELTRALAAAEGYYPRFKWRAYTADVGHSVVS